MVTKIPLPFTYTGTPVRVVDGDTFVATMDLGFHVSTRITVRILGIDAPEMHAKDDAERAAAKEAKVFLGALLASCECLTISTKSVDKYGRWLAEVWTDDGKTVAEEMKKAGKAKERFWK